MALSPPLSSLPLPSLPLLSPPIPALPFPPPPSLRSRAPQIQLGVWGSAVSSPSGMWGGALAEIELVHFSLKIRHLVATILKRPDSL